MLETEPQNLQPDPNEPEANRQSGGQEGSQRRGLLRRSRRNVTKPAETPASRSGSTEPASQARPGAVQPNRAETGSAGQAGNERVEAGQSGGAARGRSAGSAGRVAGPVPAVPMVPTAEPVQRRGFAGPQQPVPVASFQAPVVVFQPPDLTERRTAEARPRQDSGAQPAPSAAEVSADSEGGGSRRRRRGGRGRGKGTAGEGGGGAEDTGAGQGSAGQGSAGQGSAGQGSAGQAAGQGGRVSGAGQNGGHAASAEAAVQAGTRAQVGGEGGDVGTEEAGGTSSSRRRRHRRQRSGSGAGEAETPASDDPTDTVVHVREPRPQAEPDDVRAVKGSTRLEAKRQRRRESRDTGRRRPPIISESEFLARREAVERVMLVRQQGERTQIAVLEDDILVEHYVDKASHQSYVGNVYLGKVQNVLPSMEAAFVDIGKGRNAVLYAGEVNFDASGLEGVAKRIESALKSGQSIMVQVTKDPIGHKGARLTSQVSLPGRYLVYVPGASMTGISRKLPDTERTRLKQILKKVAPEEGGIIVRTAAEGATEEELLHDVTRLVAQWQAIERKAKTASAPDLLYGEPDLTIRVVRDIFNEDFTKLVIASDSEWDLVDEYVRYVAPNLSERLERWAGDEDLFGAYRIDEQLAKALDRKVWLPSGGSLVIDTTEAMTVIDVNTGKFTGQGGNLEQTVTRNNLEAAEEIVRQLRLRDIGGIIVIDFIDMVLESNRDLVLRRLIECLARDRTKHQVAEVTSLGLVQMTRKRVGSGLLAAFSVPCEQCSGRGVLISTELTDLPHLHGRNGQQAAPKPGMPRSRSARSNAIAQVAAKTIETRHEEQEVVAVADAEETELAAAGITGSALAEVEPAETGLAKAEAKQAQVRSGSGRSAANRAKRTEAAASENGRHPAESQATGAPVVAGAEPAPSTSSMHNGNGEAATAAAVEAPKRRVRRSAYREAGPPDPAQPAEPQRPPAQPVQAHADPQSPAPEPAMPAQDMPAQDIPAQDMLESEVPASGGAEPGGAEPGGLEFGWPDSAVAVPGVAVPGEAEAVSAGNGGPETGEPETGEPETGGSAAGGSAAEEIVAAEERSV